MDLTDAGRAYYERVARLAEKLEAAEKAVFSQRDEPSGTFRVTAPPDDAGVIWAMVSGFVKNHPNVEFELIHSLRAFIEHVLKVVPSLCPHPTSK